MKKSLKRMTAMAVSCAMVLSWLAGCSHEHDWSDWEVEKEASCTDTGRKVRSCECGEEQTKKIPVLSHTEGKWVTDKEATCTEDGKKHLVCAECDESYKEETIASTGEHDYKCETTKNATCQQEGLNTYTCTACEDSYTEKVPCKEYTSTEIHEMYLDSVGEVVTYDRSGDELALGSCFVYTADGKVITNYHVIEDAYSVEIGFGDKTYDVEYVLAYDKDIDVAVLQIDAKNLKPVVICEETHKVGSVVYAFGNSRGLTSTFSDGMITYADREVDGVVYTQHDAPISGGNSGGPLINAYGEVIGINTWTMRDSQNLNFAINMEELDNLNYGTKLTMAELYNKECNAFAQLRNYITAEGTYDSELDAYSLTVGTDYNSDYTHKYTRVAYYFVTDNEISLDIVMDSGKYWVYLELTEDLSGSYRWNYFDEYDNKMRGSVRAYSFTDDTTLSYDSTNVTDYTVKNAVQQLSSSMLALILLYMYEDYADIGVTPADIGFANI